LGGDADSSGGLLLGELADLAQLLAEGHAEVAGEDGQRGGGLRVGGDPRGATGLEVGLGLSGGGAVRGLGLGLLAAAAALAAGGVGLLRGGADVLAAGAVAAEAHPVLDVTEAADPALPAAAAAVGDLVGEVGRADRG